jgi:hypothetical protein
MQSKMQDQSIISTTDELVGALDALDVPFLMGGVQNETALTLSPATLFAGLAQAPEARVRSAIIPLLLRHPEFAPVLQLVASTLQGQAQYTLELFYTAAMLLQRKYEARLTRLFGAQPMLPDWFSKELEIDLDEDLEKVLAGLSARHAELRGLQLDWTVTYEHAAQVWLKHMELLAERARTPPWQVT